MASGWNVWVYQEVGVVGKLLVWLVGVFLI